jgi:hypothetical protein
MNGQYPRFKNSYFYEELTENFLLTPAELEFVRNCRGDVNRHALLHRGLMALFGKSRQLRGELTGRRVHLRSKKHRILQKAICNSFLQFLQIFRDAVKT